MTSTLLHKAILLAVVIVLALLLGSALKESSQGLLKKANESPVKVTLIYGR